MSAEDQNETVSVPFSGRALGQVKAMSARDGIPASVVIQRAIAMYNWTQKKRRGGYEVCARKEKWWCTEIITLTIGDDPQ